MRDVVDRAGGKIVDDENFIPAIQQGLDLKIISDNVLTVAEFVWAVKPDSPIKSIKDLKGAKIGYTNPRSTSQGLAMLLVREGGLKPDDAELVRTGGFGEGVVALETGQITVAPIPEPLWAKYKTKYRAIAVASEILPPLDNVIGVTTSIGMTESCSKLCAQMPRMKPNRQKLTAISTMKPSIAIGWAIGTQMNR